MNLIDCYYSISTKNSKKLYVCHFNRYGEVYWTMMDPVPLDANLVSRFKDKTMAIVGYESDQVPCKVLLQAAIHKLKSVSFKKAVEISST